MSMREVGRLGYRHNHGRSGWRRRLVSVAGGPRGLGQAVDRWGEGAVGRTRGDEVDGMKRAVHRMWCGPR